MRGRREGRGVPRACCLIGGAGESAGNCMRCKGTSWWAKKVDLDLDLDLDLKEK